MALILPGQQGGSGLKTPTKARGSSLILPGKTSPEQAKEILARREKISGLRADAAAADKEASAAENAASFLNVLGDVGKKIAQGTGKSFLAAGNAINELGAAYIDTARGAPLSRFKEVTSKPVSPDTPFVETLSGEKGGFSFTSIGEEFSPLVEKLGVSPETAKKIAPFSGFLIGSLDVVPVGGSSGPRLLAKETLEALAKETSEEVILKTIKNSLKGGEAEVKTLAEAIAQVSDPKEVKAIIEAATTKSVNAPIVSTKPAQKVEKLTVPPQLENYAASLRNDGFTKSEFLARLGQAIDSVDETRALNAIEFTNDLKEAGFTPGRFFDAVHGIPVVRDTGGIGGKAGLKAVGLSNEERMITRAESSLLRERIQNIARGAREGSVSARAEVKAIQKEVGDLITRNLPPNLRGALLVTLRNANRPSKLDAALRTVEDHIIDYNVLKQQAKQLSTIRSRIGFIRKVAGLNQTAVNDVKRSLNIDKPLRKMNESELKQVSNELIKRFQFKKEGGMLPEVPKSRETSAPDSFYAQFGAEQSTYPSRVKEEGSAVYDGIKTIGREYLGVISTQLANIDESLKYALRGFEYRSRQTALRDMTKAVDFAKVAEKMSKEDRVRLDIAMKNGLSDDIDALAEKYGFTSELKATRDMLNGIYERSKDVGLDVRYRKNFFPRAFKQDKKSARGILEYFQRVDKLGTFQKAFREEETKFGRPLTDIEKVDVINTMLRGYQRGGVGLSATGSLKNRLIETVTPEINPFYQDSFNAMFNYVEAVNNLIEARRFFGKHLDLKGIDPQANMQDVIGGYVNNLIAAGKISSEQQNDLQRILAARFAGKKMNPALGALKDTGYLTVMSSLLNAVTQVGDLGFAFYRAGAKDASLGLKDALRGKKITKEDLGISDIQAEFADRTLLSEGVNLVFKLSGLNRVDRLGKETFINGTYRNLLSEADSAPDALAARIKPIFGDETAQVVADIKSGDISDNVKYLLFNELLDFQPVALSEVPLKYLEAPNGRVLYALKTYTLKLLDVYRREVIQTIKRDPKQGLKNLVRLGAYLMFFNATANQVKDWITGQETSVSDATAEAIAQSIGFSPYAVQKAKQEGIGSAALSFVLPPTQLADDLSKDAGDIFTKGDELDPLQMRTIRNLPIGGKLFYWWFGRGAAQKEKAKKGSSEENTSTANIPLVTLPSVNTPTVNIPSVST